MTSSYHLEDRDKCNKNTCANTCNVPKLRFKGYNVEWKKVRTEEIFENVTIKNKPSLPVLAVTQERGTILRESCGINIKYENESLKSYKLVKPGNFIISLRSFQGGLEYSGLEGIVSPAYTILNNKQSISYDFFKYYFKTYNFIKSLNIAVEGIRDGKQISYNSFKDIKITFPNIEEQEKIASFLTLIDKKIEKQKELVELLKKYKRGLLSAIFSQKLKFKDDNGNDYPAWEEKRLGDICKIVGGGTTDTNNVKYWGDDINWFTPTEIIKKYADSSNRKISRLGLLKSSAKILPIGTVLLTTRATLGEMSILSIEATTNQGFQSLIPVKDEVSSEFIYYCQPIIKHFCYKYANGSTFLEISKQTLAKLKLMIPNKDEQNKISDFLSKFDNKIQQEECILSYLKTYKKGLLQQMFI